MFAVVIVLLGACCCKGRVHVCCSVVKVVLVFAVVSIFLVFNVVQDCFVVDDATYPACGYKSAAALCSLAPILCRRLVYLLSCESHEACCVSKQSVA